MEMIDYPGAARQAAGNPRVVGDAVRYAFTAELLQAVAATLRFTLLNPSAWTYERLAEHERDELRMVVERLETARTEDLTARCPVCGCHTCEDGCPLKSLRWWAA